MVVIALSVNATDLFPVLSGQTQQSSQPLLLNQQTSNTPDLMLLAGGGYFRPYMATAIGRCNVRSRPTTKSPVIFEIYNNEWVTVSARSGKNWFFIYDGYNNCGWTHRQNLRFQYYL